MAKILLGVTGSVAAIYTRDLYEDLGRAGHDVKIIATAAALYFFDPATLTSREPGQRNRDIVILDKDEWPGSGYQRGDPVLHIELRRWADLLLIAPLDANTLAKLALGMCDNCLTCVYRAWERARPIVLAPAMNTLMWEHPSTARHLRQIAADISEQTFPQEDALELCARINMECRGLRIVPPISKKLACDDVGLGALASRDTVLAAVAQAAQQE